MYNKSHFFYPTKVCNLLKNESIFWGVKNRLLTTPQYSRYFLVEGEYLTKYYII